MNHSILSAQPLLKEKLNMIWITWEKQLRNRSMAFKLNAKLYEIDLPGNRIKRYIVGTLKTLYIIIRNKPKIIFAQNPSIVLTTLMVLFKPVLKYKFISDSHFAGVMVYNGNKLVQELLDFCNKRADIVIVTNSEQANYINSIGGTAFICEDPLPDLRKYKEQERMENKEVLFICSFDVDEPHEEVFKAANGLVKEGYRIYVSGNYKKVNINPEDYPQVIFLGYLPEELFYKRLFKSQVIVDLTNFENCLVCGAYEAMAAEKPLVLSDKYVLRQYFTKGTVYTGNNHKNIADAIKIASENSDKLMAEVRKWKESAIMENDQKICKLLELINEF